MRRSLCRLVVLSLFLSCTAVLCSAETEQPLVISSQSVTESAGWSVLHLNLTNTSNKPVVGYAVLVKFNNSSGQLAHPYATSINLMGLEPPPAPQSVSPGSSTQVETHIPRQAPSGPSLGVQGVSVDYVRFSDGSSWGPDTAHESKKIDGIETGWHTAAIAIKQMLTQQGVDAVENYLNAVTTHSGK